MKYVSIDLEMTGLDADTCDVLEFGAVLDDLKGQSIPVSKLPTFHCYFLPLREGQNFQGSPFALAMNAKILQRIADREPGYDYYSPNGFGKHFKRFLVDHGYQLERDKVAINVAGKNFGSCDLQFLNKCTDLSKHVHIRHKILDPAILCLHKSDESMPGLSKCKERAGFNSKVTHNAVDDAIDVVNLIRWGVGDKFK